MPQNASKKKDVSFQKRSIDEKDNTTVIISFLYEERCVLVAVTVTSLLQIPLLDHYHQRCTICKGDGGVTGTQCSCYRNERITVVILRSDFRFKFPLYYNVTYLS